jgi:hypothetical protein
MQLAKRHKILKRNQQLSRGKTPDAFNKDIVGHMAEQNLRSVSCNPQKSFLTPAEVCS